MPGSVLGTRHTKENLVGWYIALALLVQRGCKMWAQETVPLLESGEDMKLRNLRRKSEPTCWATKTASQRMGPGVGSLTQG